MAQIASLSWHTARAMTATASELSACSLETWTQPPPIVIAMTADRGRGVFAARDIEAGEVIEQCPMIVVDAADAPAVCETVLGQYAYGWDDGAVAIALGYGSLYNHATEPNAFYEEGDDPATMVVRANRWIGAGEEVLIDYTGGGVQELWFEPL